MSRWLSVLGIGADGVAGLTPAAHALLATAETLVGGARHLAMVQGGAAERLTWSNPLERTIEEIAARRGRRVAVLASGDPMFFGIGATLARRFPAEEMTVIPAVGTAALVCARLCWPEAEVEAVSVHGRPLETLNCYLRPGARLVVFSEGGGTPARVAALLAAQGFGPSPMTVLEDLGGPAERQAFATAEAWPAAAASDLNAIAIECRLAPGAMFRPRVPGLPDEAYEHDGQLTKREIRAAALAALAPHPGALLWDVGAGCGSVSIEWLRAERWARAIAVERDAGRAALIAGNAAALGVPWIEIVAAEAPRALMSLPRPDAVFIGGGTAREEILSACWDALPPGGRLVAHAVTIEGETRLLEFRERSGGALSRLSVERLEPLGREGGRHGWRPLRAVVQLAALKPVR